MLTDLERKVRLDALKNTYGGMTATAAAGVSLYASRIVWLLSEAERVTNELKNIENELLDPNVLDARQNAQR